jgi:catechol 2,3-dioxygenase-like lactoylglutathione lyase family enzyme
MTFGGVTLNVKDLTAAKEFYAKLPGAELTRDEPDIATFAFGDARVSLRQTDEPGFHLEMESDEQANDRKVFLSDPDGHRIEVEHNSSGTSDHRGAFFNPERDEENAGLG